MIQTNILEQLIVLFNNLKSNHYALVIAIVSLLMLLLLNRFKTKKITKILLISTYILIFGILIYFYYQPILELLDYLMDNIFIFLFFPNLAIYVLVLIIINVIIIKSSFSKRDNKLINNINIVFFVIFNVIFYLIIKNIITNNINVYEQLSIYTNNDLLILIELSMKLFIIWIISLLIIKIISLITLYAETRKKVNKNLVLANSYNQKELDYIKPLSQVVNESIPLQQTEKPVYNIYNEYINVEPIKIKKETPKVTLSNFNNYLEVPIQEVNVFDTTNNINEIRETEEFTTKKSINVSNDIKNQVEETNNNLNYINNQNTNKFIFTNLNQIENLDEKIKPDMDNIFSSNKSYLKDIILDVETLRVDQDNKEKIESIYKQVELNEKKLTLSDYNILIDMLTGIKK